MVHGVEGFAQVHSRDRRYSFLVINLFLQTSVIFSNAVQQEWVFINPDKFEDKTL